MRDRWELEAAERAIKVAQGHQSEALVGLEIAKQEPHAARPLRKAAAELRAAALRMQDAAELAERLADREANGERGCTHGPSFVPHLFRKRKDLIPLDVIDDFMAVESASLRRRELADAKLLAVMSGRIGRL